ncbi:peptidyl-prolyl cis-trans isomerase [Candidatus Cloacimonadota bacterium]
MYKLKLLIILILLPLILNTIPIASVEDQEITYDQLTEEMESLELKSDMTYAQIREQALENLIEEKLLVIYANENNVTVDELELDSFFINHLGDHPRFLTEGNFDRSKYREFKSTETGKQIIKEMESEILISKVRTMLNNSFHLSDDNLFKEYVLQNAEIDISYAIVDVEMADVPKEFSFLEAERYFNQNRKEFRTEEKVKLQIVVIPFTDHEATAGAYLNLMERSLIEADTNLTEVQIDSLRQTIYTNELQELTFKEAQRVKLMLELNQQIKQPLLETGFISIEDNYGSLPQGLIFKAFEQTDNHFTEPFRTEIGYIVFRVIERQEPRNQNLSEVAEEVWLSYIDSFRKEAFHDEFRKYFYTHIDKFIIPVAVVKIVAIPGYGFFQPLKDKDEQDRLLNSLNRSVNDEIIFNDVIDQYGLENQTQIVYLDKFQNKDRINDIIANRINHSDNYGSVIFDNEFFFFRLDSYFPEYIPNYRDIQDQFTEVEVVTEVDSTEYQEFYHNYKIDFQTPDSLQLGGLYFPLITDSIYIDSLQVIQYYNDNINNYYRGKAVEFDYISVSDESTAHRIRDYAVAGTDFELLKYCYNNSDPFPVNTLISENDLPREIIAVLFAMRDNSFSFPVNYKNNWFIFSKSRSFSEGLRSLDDVYNEIEHIFQFQIADSLAHSYAKIVFDSTRYYSQCFKYKNYGELFKTSFQEADKDFKLLGNLKDYKQDLMRLWKNEKYSSIFPLKEGYAVLFQLNKKSAKQLSYEQALPELEAIFQAKEKLKNSKEFLNTMREKVLTGSDPDSLFFFLGGWKSARNIDLESEIFGPEYSRLILYDLVEKEVGYCSPVLTLAENVLFFYKIERLEMVTPQEFEAQKEFFKKKVETEKYESWLNQFRSNFDIFINF